jgi:alpha-1,2-mannosyltransferase
MTVDMVIAFARRNAAWALLSIIPLWGMFFWQMGRALIQTDYQLDRNIICADHMAFYTGARLSRDGPADKVYDYVFVTSYQNQLFYKDPSDPEKDAWRWLEAFRNPPFYAILYWPTCGWTYFWSAATWFVISMGLTFAGVWWTADRSVVWTMLWVLSFLPTYMAFDYGQNTPISFAIFAATYALLRAERPFAAGLVAGLLLFKPQLLLGLGLWAVLDFRRKWPCALGVAVMGVMLVAGSWPLMPETWRGFLDTFKANRQFDSFDQFKMHNPLAMIRLLLPADEIAANWFPDRPAADVVAIVREIHNGFAIVCGVVATVVFVRLWWVRHRDLHVMMGAVVFFTLWAGPHALIYEWQLLALTGILWHREWGRRPNTWFVYYLVIWSVLYFTTDLNAMILDAKFFKPLTGINMTMQWSVPVTGLFGLLAVRQLTRRDIDHDH